MAGYNVILQSSRQYDDESPAARTSANAHLVDTWAYLKAAATWITSVLGEEKITTYTAGDKQSVPGIGLLPDYKKLTAQISQKLQNLVTGKDAITLKT